MLHPQTVECAFFSNACGTFSRIEHLLGHRTILNKVKEIIPSIWYDHNDIKLEMNYKEKVENHKYVEIKQHAIG